MSEEERPIRQISSEELQKILEQHLLWLESEMKEGARADLSYANLARANLSGADLSFADLRGTDLRGALLTCVQLQSSRGWMVAYRDPELACGSAIPNPPEERVD